MVGLVDFTLCMFCAIISFYFVGGGSLVGLGGIGVGGGCFLGGEDVEGDLDESGAKVDKEGAGGAGFLRRLLEDGVDVTCSGSR